MEKEEIGESGEGREEGEWEQVGPKNKSTLTRQVGPRSKCSIPAARKCMLHPPCVPLVCVNPAAIATTFDLSETPCASLRVSEVTQLYCHGDCHMTLQVLFSESVVSEVFGGKLRCVLQRQGAKESATVEPFFSLQLDIQVPPSPPSPPSYPPLPPSGSQMRCGVCRMP